MDVAIDRLQREAAGSPEVVGLAGGLPAEELFPRDALASAFFAALAERHCAALQYGWPEGDAALREWISERLRARGADVGPDDLIVTNGAQQAIALAVERLAARGTRAGVDDVTYPAALDLFRSRGVSLHAPEEKVDWRYVVPGVDNPRGRDLSPDRRRAILASDAPFIADEAYAELRFDGVVPRPLIADARDRAWHVGTLSKTLSPGLRVGWLVPPRSERAAALEAKRDRDLQAPSLTQIIAREFVRRTDFDAHLARARAFYARRAERLASCLRRRLPSWRFEDPEGGFSLFVETDLQGDEVEFLEHAARHGVSFDPSRLFRREQTAAPIAMRLSFSNTSDDALDDAVARLERAARRTPRMRAD